MVNTNSKTKLDYIEISPETKGKRALKSVIWLHGLGADGHDFESLVPELHLPESLAIRFIFPHAPVRPVTINNGMSMRAWYDVIALSLEAEEDEAGIREGAHLLEELIEQEHQRGIPYEDIILAGFSQGAALVLHTALRFPHQLGGVVALSSYLPLFQRLASEANAANRELPIFMAHGTLDPVIPLMLGEWSKGLLQSLGYAVDWHTYPMEHAVCAEEIQEISRQLVRLCSS